MAGVAGEVGLAAIHAAKRKLRGSLKAALNSMTAQERAEESQALVRKVRGAMGIDTAYRFLDSAYQSRVCHFAFQMDNCEVSYVN